jgi:translation initiation factor 2 beta subunit (eIF-2beta)/eIF-5
VLYGGDQHIFSTRKSIQKLGLHSKRSHTVIDLGDGKSFTAILKSSSPPVTDDILHIDSFKSLVIKKSLLKFLLKSLVTQKSYGDLRPNNRKLKVKFTSS